MPVPVRCVLTGLGNVGRSLLEILLEKGGDYRERLGLDIQVVAAADTSGGVVSDQPLDLETIVGLKRARKGVAGYPGAQAGLGPREAVRQAEADALLEATVTNLTDGQPGLGCVEAALERGLHVVTANKGPLVLDYARLAGLAQAKQVGLAFSATVGGGLPSVNVGRRDLVPARILKLEAILNSTTHYILTRMEEDGQDFDAALAGAQKMGVAEADPRLDIDGWDAASKLVILANAVLGRPTSLGELQVEGIHGIGQETLRQARLRGRVVKLLALAEPADGDWRLSVGPTALDESHPLAGLRDHELGIVYETDVLGRVSTTIRDRSPMGTSAAMLRDLLNLYLGR